MPRRSASAGVQLVADDAESILVRNVRDFLRDNKALNALLDSEETSDLLLRLYVGMALDDWNITPPLIGTVDITTHPAPSLLIWKTVQITLWSAAILQERNRLQYSDGGISVQTSDKAEMYLRMASQLDQVYEAKKRSLKKSINIEGAYGGVASEYLLTNYTAFWNSSMVAYEVMADGFRM